MSVHHGGNESDSSEMSVEVDRPSYTIGTQNRFEMDDGRGDPWIVEGSRGKRKKLNSDSLNSECFVKLSQDDKLICLFNNLNRNYEKLNEIESTQKKCSEDTQYVNKRVDSMCQRTGRVEKFIDTHTSKLKLLAYKSIDLEARSRRNNIIFWGITEKSEIDCKTLILNFIEDELDLDTSNVYIERAHRLGSLTSDTNRSRYDPKRPIIVRLRDYDATELILDRAYKLKNTPFGIDRDYPREIADARKRLYKSESAKSARINRQKIQIKYPARLYIDGKVERDEFPGWFKIMRESRVDGFEPPGEENNSAYNRYTNWEQIRVLHQENSNMNQSTYSHDTDIDNANDTETFINQSTQNTEQPSYSAGPPRTDDMTPGNAHLGNVNKYDSSHVTNSTPRGTLHLGERDQNKNHTLPRAWNSPQGRDSNTKENIPLIIPAKLFSKQTASGDIPNNISKNNTHVHVNSPIRERDRSRSLSTNRMSTSQSARSDAAGFSQPLVKHK